MARSVLKVCALSYVFQLSRIIGNGVESVGHVFIFRDRDCIRTVLGLDRSGQRVTKRGLHSLFRRGADRVQAALWHCFCRVLLGLFSRLTVSFLWHSFFCGIFRLFSCRLFLRRHFFRLFRRFFCSRFFYRFAIRRFFFLFHIFCYRHVAVHAGCFLGEPVLDRARHERAAGNVQRLKIGRHIHCLGIIIRCRCNGAVDVQTGHRPYAVAKIACVINNAC